MSMLVAAATPRLSVEDVIVQFRAALLDAGIAPPEEIEADGQRHRFSTNGTRGDDAGWYVLHADGIPAGAFGDWRTGVSQTWRADITPPLSSAEEAAYRARIAAIQREREAAEAQRHADARAKASAIWNAATSTGDHPYLQAKGVKAHNLRVHDGSLVVPMRDGKELHSLQFISSDGAKRFLPGGRVNGSYFSIGKPNGVLCVVEGYATGASIHEATGHAVAVAFNAGNLLAVAKRLRRRYPRSRIIVCADDDYRTEVNPGLTKAREAAHAVSGLLAVPGFGESRPEGATDFNDLHRHAGVEAVRACIERVATLSPNEIEPVSVGLIRGSDIKLEPVAWLWEGWLAAGKLHVLAGAPGTGKTTCGLALAATITTGGRWPDGSRSAVGNVVIWSGEDDAADTLIPRLVASGADVQRVFIIDGVREGNERRSFDPARDMEPLRRKLEQIGDVQLLIVDPIVSAVAGDSHKNAEVRRGLQPLVDLAADMRCALLGITHFSKGTGGRDPVERLTGSLAFGALPRVVLVAAKQQEEGENGRAVRLFLRAKSNIGPDDGGFEYDLHQTELTAHPGIFASFVQWGAAVEGKARNLLVAAESTTERSDQTERGEAAKWLREVLADGQIEATEIKRLAKEAGFSTRTIERALHAAGVESRRDGFGKGARYYWRLKGMLANQSHVRQPSEAGEHGKHENWETEL